jgi:hypothetical protein
MPEKTPSITNIALVGGGEFCREILEKTTSVYEREGVLSGREYMLPYWRWRILIPTVLVSNWPTNWVC